jgi:hypothetical protein
MCNFLADTVALFKWRARMTDKFEENIVHPSHFFANIPTTNRKPQKYIVYFPALLAASAYATSYLAAAFCT